MNLQLPRSLPQQRLFRGIRRRKMGIRKRKQMSSAPLPNPSQSNLPEYMLPSTGTTIIISPFILLCYGDLLFN